MSHTPGPWFPVEYGGYWDLQAKDEYSENDDLLNTEKCPLAPYNALLAASAPLLLEYLKDLYQWSAHFPQLANEDLKNAKVLLDILENTAPPGFVRYHEEEYTIDIKPYPDFEVNHLHFIKACVPKWQTNDPNPIITYKGHTCKCFIEEKKNGDVDLQLCPVFSQDDIGAGAGNRITKSFKKPV